MSRYDWPPSQTSDDDPGGRARYVGRFLPAANVRFEDGSLAPPTPAPKQPKRKRPRPKAPPTGGTNLWLPIGPSTVITGQATGRPMVSGRIRDLAVEPTMGNRIYAASAGGGVWYSKDRGANWIPLEEFVVSPNRSVATPVGSALSCGAIHVIWGALNDGSDDEVFVGTGEPDDTSPGGNPGGSLLGVGLLQAIGPAFGHGWLQITSGADFRGKYFWRIVASPLNAAHLFAAVSDGVYVKPVGSGWARMAGSPSNVCDLLVTQFSATQLRVWAATKSGLKMATVDANPAPGATTTFTDIGLPTSVGFSRKMMALGSATELWILGKRVRAKDAKFDPAQLWRINPAVVIPAGPPLGTPPPQATVITGVPDKLFGGTKDQSHYDMCVTVHPDASNVVFVGGSGLTIQDAWNAAIYRLQVTGTSATSTHVGVGVHADVHVIRIGAKTLPPGTDRTVWVGCDGGVFMSGADGRADSFVTRNNQISTLEPGYVASHPTNDGIVAAGMQDNGTCERAGDSIWRVASLGDGGGLVYDPGHSNRYFRQYIHAHWESSTGGSTPVVFRNSNFEDGSSEAYESARSLFYSGASAIQHGGVSHLVIGTDRPWYSADWGKTWITVPTGSDPRATINVDLGQDLINPGPLDGKYTDPRCCAPDARGTQQGGSKIITTRLSPADSGTTQRIRLHVLWQRGFSVFLGTKPAAVGTAWKWAIDFFEIFRSPATPPESAAFTSGAVTTFLPAADRISDMAVHDPQLGVHGSVYVTTIGPGPLAAPTALVDTLWWYNGSGTWMPCGLRKVVTRGRWSGDRNVSPALAVVVDPVDPNIVYVGTSVGVVRGVFTPPSLPASPEPHWDWSTFENGLPEAAVNDLSIFSDGNVKLLRAALHGRGVWEVDLKTVVAQPRTLLRMYPSDTRRRRVASLLTPVSNGETLLRFDASPDIVVDLSAIVDGPGGPSEADLFTRAANLQVGEYASQAFSKRTFKIHVLVHHRWFAGATPAQVKVMLLRRDMNTANHDTDLPLDGIWAPIVAHAGGTAMPSPLPGGWQQAGSQLVRPIATTVEARLPRAATFDIDLTGHVNRRVMFVAVVMSADDQIEAGDALKPDASVATLLSELVMTSRHVAARSVHLD